MKIYIIYDTFIRTENGVYKMIAITRDKETANKYKRPYRVQGSFLGIKYNYTVPNHYYVEMVEVI